MTDDGYTRITLRIPDALHAKLTAEAARTSKSMNAEIVARLESTFDGTLVSDATAEEIADKAVNRALEHFFSLVGPKGWEEVDEELKRRREAAGNPEPVVNSLGRLAKKPKPQLK